MNFAGLDEAGIDGGGIFREFMAELIKTAFDPNRGFFCSTADKLLYPNPQARLLVDNFTSHYYFLGRVLGKVSCCQVVVAKRVLGAGSGINIVIIIIIIIILGQRISVLSGDDREHLFLFQRISVAIQRFNAVLLHDGFPSEDHPD